MRFGTGGRCGALGIEDWRVVYAVDETWKELGVLAVARRPPYRYEDLEALLEDLGSAR